MKTPSQEQPPDNLPAKLSNPARRALASAGIARLEQLTAISEAEIKKLHGIGPNAIEQLRQSLAANGLAFNQEQSK